MASKPGRPQSSRDFASLRNVERQSSGSGSPVNRGLSEGSSTKGGVGAPASSARASSRKAERHSPGGGGLSLSSGFKERPSTNGGVGAPASSAKVGAKSLLRTSSWRLAPLGTPGPRTIRGTLMSSS